MATGSKRSSSPKTQNTSIPTASLRRTPYSSSQQVNLPLLRASYYPDKSSSISSKRKLELAVLLLALLPLQLARHLNKSPLRQLLLLPLPVLQLVEPSLLLHLLLLQRLSHKSSKNQHLDHCQRPASQLKHLLLRLQQLRVLALRQQKRDKVTERQLRQIANPLQPLPRRRSLQAHKLVGQPRQELLLLFLTTQTVDVLL